MPFRNSIQLLRLFLKGKSSEYEDNIIDNWYNSIDDSRPLDLWKEEGKKETIRRELKHRIEARMSISHFKGGSVMTPRGSSLRWVAAASIILLMGVGYWFLYHRASGSGPLAQTAFSAPLGEIRKIQLPDGSTVWLRSGTTLQYSTEYGVRDRQVEISEGEAFFDVKKDNKHPFVVHAGGLRTRVLGTAFDIRAYNTDATVQVWVENGRVQVSDSKKILGELVKDHRLRYDRAGKTFQSDSLRWKKVLAWQKGILLLESANFDELSRELKELYGISLMTDAPTIRELHYDAKFFIHTPLENILSTLAEVHGLKYLRQENTVRFYQPEESPANIGGKSHP